MASEGALLLFDVDGTLIDAQGAGYRSMDRAGRQVVGDGFDLSGVSFAGSLDPVIFHEATRERGRSPTPEEHERFRDVYVALLADELSRRPEEVRALPGVLSLLGRLRDLSGVALGLLTGNYQHGAELKLQRSGIEPDWFPIGAFGDAAPSRPELVPVALAQYVAAYGRTLDPSRVVIIGDTPRDVECARANGCRVLAVATGRYSVEELQALGPDAVARDLSEPGPLFEWLSEL